MKKIKLVIFDLDGTLADTLEGITEGLNRTLAPLGYPTHTTDSVRRFVNFGVRQFMEEALPSPACNDSAEVERVMRLYNENYAETYTMTHAFDGMAELLERLSEHCLVAMNSNKQDEFVKALANQLFRPGLFVATEGFRNDRPGKPDPSMAFSIMQRAEYLFGESLTPSECVYVGDSDIDVLTAKNAGMHCISVSWGYRPADYLRTLGNQPVCATPEALWDELIRLGVQA